MVERMVWVSKCDDKPKEIPSFIPFGETDWCTSKRQRSDTKAAIERRVCSR